MKKTLPLLISLLCLALYAPVRSYANATNSASDHLEQHHVSRGEKIARWMEDHGVSRPVAIAAISTLPIVELRGAIPTGHILYKTGKLDRSQKIKKSLQIFGIAVAGNMIPIPFILLLLGPVSKFCMRFKIGQRFFEWLFARTRKKSANIAKYEALGLTIFVAIPLPVTGGWTGAMAAFLMGIPFWQSMLCILLGVMIAGVIMTILSLLGWMGALIAGVVLLALATGTVLKSFNKKGE